MGVAYRHIIVAVSVTVLCIYYQFHQLTKPVPKPEFNHNKYWGNDANENDTSDKRIKSFQINRKAEELQELFVILNQTFLYTPPLEGIKFEYGFNHDVLKNIVTYWRDDYLPRWREREAFLNQFKQYTVNIQGLNVHFIHEKPNPADTVGKKVLPLLLLHGWPGSIREFYELIPMLIKPSSKHDFIFEVVAPSLVGYGWSEGTSKTGFNNIEMGIVMRNLMVRLGYKEFLIQAGDWGAIIAQQISTIFPENVIGYHSNLCILYTLLSHTKSFIKSFTPRIFMEDVVYKQHFPMGQKYTKLFEEAGYYHLQATKPDTIGVALLNNPVGLAAYILEKFQYVTGPINQDPDALEKVYGLDKLLDNIMIYYLSNIATTAARFYAENMTKKFSNIPLNHVQSPVKLGCAKFFYEITPAFDWALKDKFPNLIQSNYYDFGGHFAALEIPDVLYNDFIQFVKALDYADQ